MLSHINIKNFQSHKDTELKLSTGVNIVIGASDSGKTAIVRALRWLTWNKPGGDSFRSSWGGDTSVSLTLTNGPTVTRFRNNKENVYEIVGTGDPMEYNAFGSEPPEDVVKLLALSEINVQQQLDRPFLLDSSPGQVAQYLNSVAKLDVIDRAVASIARWARELGATAAALTARKEQLEESLASYTYLPEMERAIEGLENRERERAALWNERDALRAALSGALRSTHELRKLAKLTQLSEPVRAALGHMSELRKLRSAAVALLAPIQGAKRAEQRLESSRSVRALAPLVVRAEAAQAAKLEVVERSNRLTALVTKVARTDASAGKIAQELRKLRSDFKEAIGEQCPLCESTIRHEHKGRKDGTQDHNDNGRRR
jgi:exonuclease SbcC